MRITDGARAHAPGLPPMDARALVILVRLVAWVHAYRALEGAGVGASIDLVAEGHASPVGPHVGECDPVSLLRTMARTARLAARPRAIDDVGRRDSTGV